MALRVMSANRSAGDRALLLLLALCLLILTSTASAGLSEYNPGQLLSQPASGPAPDVITATGDFPVRITRSALLLEDPTTELTLTEVLNAPGWVTPDTDSLAFGYSRSAWWLQWSIRNPYQDARTLVISLGQPRHDYALWFILRDHDAPPEMLKSGDRIPFADTPLRSRTIAAPIALGPGESVRVLVRLSTYDGLFEPILLNLHTAQGFANSHRNEDLVLMLFFGGVIALALYNLLLFFSTREKAFGLYVHYLFWFVAWNLIWWGYGYQWLWPDNPRLANDYLTITAAGIFASVGLFTIHYLRLREKAPALILKLLYLFIFANIAVALFALSGHYFMGVVAGWLAGIPIVFLAIGTAVWLAVRQFRPAYFFLLAFSVLAVGATAYILQIATVLPSNWFTTWGIQIGSALEVLILALGLADSMNQLKSEKLQAERDARLAEKLLTMELETMVQERTLELDRANQKLRNLAVTDELTGAFNRRHFNDIFDQMLNTGPRDEPLAFCMFDIDYFKVFNDQLGHQAGDVALKEVAGVIQNTLKRASDVFFRLGGEEFGLLFTARSPEQAFAFIEDIRLHLVNKGIHHPGTEKQVLTASFGIVWCPAGAQLERDQIYQQADELLYQAKSKGRNRVESAVINVP